MKDLVAVGHRAPNGRGVVTSPAIAFDGQVRQQRRVCCPGRHQAAAPDVPRRPARARRARPTKPVAPVTKAVTARLRPVDADARLRRAATPAADRRSAPGARSARAPATRRGPPGPSRPGAPGRAAAPRAPSAHASGVAARATRPVSPLDHEPLAAAAARHHQRQARAGRLEDGVRQLLDHRRLRARHPPTRRRGPAWSGSSTPGQLARGRRAAP